jgi:hypothetical protein
MADDGSIRSAGDGFRGRVTPSQNVKATIVWDRLDGLVRAGIAKAWRDRRAEIPTNSSPRKEQTIDR